jgi:hypothetical protein
MKLLVASLVAVAGLATAARGQAIMRMLVSTDGVNFSSSVDAAPGSHVEALVTVSYTGTSPSVAGLGSANFQPTVSNWRTGANSDHLSPILQGGNELGSMVNAQSNATGVGSPNPYLVPTAGSNGGAAVPAGPYGAGTYGRVYPMGRTFPNSPDSLVTGFVHVNPDGSGQTYLRIASANRPDWFNPSTNSGSGGGGIDCAQLYVVGRTTRDPDFWGNRDISYDPGDPGNGVPSAWNVSGRIAANDARLQNIQVFRFGIDLSTNGAARTMMVDAPVLGQQMNPDTGQRYISFFTDPSQVIGGAQFSFGAGLAGVVPGSIHVVPSPGVVGLGGVCVMFAARRRRSGIQRVPA